VIHDPYGYWIAEAGAPAPLPALQGELSADVVVVGGGYAGMWTAWELLEAEPDLRVVVLEAEGCGLGPSGRNGGFCEGLFLSLPTLRGHFGARPARALAEASLESVGAIGAWCEAEGVDAWYRRAPQLVLSAAPAQDGIGAGAVDGEEVVEVSAAEAQRRCASPVLRAGVAVRTAATVHPARLAFGLRARLLARGARLFEGTRVRALGNDGRGVVAEAQGGRVRASAAVVAVNAASGRLRPLRDRLTVSSSHIVVTEPVPDVLEAVGWTGGEGISDGRALLHYLRTTRDGRIVFGWAGGRMAPRSRTGGRMEVDPAVIARTRSDLLRFFPGLEGRRIEHAWGGPIDVAPSHIPSVVSLPGGRAFAAFGFTGNGVGPSHLLGRILARLARDRRDALTRLPLVDAPPARVPPEPWRIAGATVLRRALARKEAAEEAGGQPDLLSRGLAALPERLGLHIVR